MQAGAAGLAALAIPGCEASRRDPLEAVDPTRCDLEALAGSLVDVTDGLEALAIHLRAGVAPVHLFGAVLLVAARAIPPDGDLHDALVVPSAYFLSTRLSGPAAVLPLARMWDLHAGESPDALAAIEPASADTASSAALSAALDAWDASAAEAIVARRYGDRGPVGVIDPLVRFGARNHDWVGHTAIWTSLTLRALDAFGWQCAPWLLRSVAGAITGNRARAVTDDFEINRARITELPSGWRSGADRPDAVPGLVDDLRLAEPQACVDRVIAATHDGLSPRTIWTALAVSAVEHGVHWNSPSYGVHELDTVNALRTLQGWARTDETARLVLLQAAAWRGLFQAFDPQAPRFEGRLLDTPPNADPPAGVAELVATIDGNSAATVSMIAGFTARGDRFAALQAAWAEVIAARAGRDHHHIKYHTALMEEMDAALPEYRGALALGMVMRGPGGQGARWPCFDEAMALKR